MKKYVIVTIAVAAISGICAFGVQQIRSTTRAQAEKDYIAAATDMDAKRLEPAAAKFSAILQASDVFKAFTDIKSRSGYMLCTLEAERRRFDAALAACAIVMNMKDTPVFHQELARRSHDLIQSMKNADALTRSLRR